jgi:hypothetical protein
MHYLPVLHFLQSAAGLDVMHACVVDSQISGIHQLFGSVVVWTEELTMMLESIVQIFSSLLRMINPFLIFCNRLTIP